MLDKGAKKMTQQNTLNDIKQTIVFNASIQKVWNVVSTAE